ncbi:MAG: DUF4097 family beta strand repeat-containing protein [Actinomycetota bacterium]
MNQSNIIAASSPRARAVRRSTALAVLAGFALTAVAAAQSGAERKQVRLDLAPGGTINIVNNAGAVNLRAGNGRQVVVAYSLNSGRMQVDHQSTPDRRRIEIRAQALPGQQPTADEAKVDLDISVPPGTSLTVNTATAPITANGISGDITLSSDTGEITLKDIARSHVHVRSVTAPVNLDNVSLGHVEVTSSGGAVKMVDVTGPKVNVATGSGNITYQGDCSGVGDYLMSTHSGNIDMRLPQTASVDLNARSVSGRVENDFPLKASKRPLFVPKAGSSFAGTSNSGSSSVELRSFSGRIRVTKQ